MRMGEKGVSFRLLVTGNAGCDKWSCRASNLQRLGRNGLSEVWEKSHEVIGLDLEILDLFCTCDIGLGWDSCRSIV